MNILVLDFATAPASAQDGPFGPRPFMAAVASADALGEGKVFSLPEHAGEFRACLDKADVLVAHDASFNLRALGHYWWPSPFHTGRKGIGCTMVLAFLLDPFLSSLDLKLLSRQLLGSPSRESEQVESWLQTNFLNWSQRYGLKGCPQPSRLREYVEAAPRDLVKQCLVGDVERCGRLGELLARQLHTAGLGVPVAREMAAVTSSVEDTIIGIKLDEARVETMLDNVTSQIAAAQSELGHWGLAEVNLNASAQVAEKMRSLGGFVDNPGLWPLTSRSKQPTMTPKALARSDLTFTWKGMECLRLFQFYTYASKVKTTYLEAWMKARHKGRLHPTWKTVGAKTGRMTSCNPSMTNIPKKAKVSRTVLDGPALQMPNVRSALVPEEGEVWLKLDIDSQEMRLAAELERGLLFQKYMEDDSFDPHSFVYSKVTETLPEDILLPGKSGRDQTKLANYLLIYGGGIPALQESLDLSRRDAEIFRNVHSPIVADVIRKSEELKKEALAGEVVYTLGGRPYYVKDASKAFSLFDYIIQGSAADMAKHVRGRWGFGNKASMRVMVYDEFNLSVPKEAVPYAAEALNALIEDSGLSVPIRASMFAGRNWAEVEPYALH